MLTVDSARPSFVFAISKLLCLPCTRARVFTQFINQAVEFIDRLWRMFLQRDNISTGIFGEFNHIHSNLLINCSDDSSSCIRIVFPCLACALESSNLARNSASVIFTFGCCVRGGRTVMIFHPILRDCRRKNAASVAGRVTCTVLIVASIAFIKFNSAANLQKIIDLSKLF